MLLFKTISLHAVSYFLAVLTIVNFSQTTDAFRLNGKSPPKFRFIFWNYEVHRYGVSDVEVKKVVVEKVVTQCSGHMAKHEQPVLEFTGQGRNLLCKVREPSVRATKARELTDVGNEVVVRPGATKNVVIFADGKMTSVGWKKDAEEFKYAGIHKVTVHTVGILDEKEVSVVSKLPQRLRYPNSAVAIQDKHRKTFAFCVIDAPEIKDELKVSLNAIPLGLIWMNCIANYTPTARRATAVSKLSMSGHPQSIAKDSINQEKVPIGAVVVQDRKGRQNVFRVIRGHHDLRHIPAGVQLGSVLKF